MTLEQTKAAINYLISEAKSSHEERALKSAFRMVEQLAEEKSGDEGALNEDSVHGAIANILDMNDDVAQHMDITIKGEPTVLVSYLKDLISRHPTPKEATEPLAVLADRKGWPRVHINEFRGNWYLSLWQYNNENPATKFPFEGDTYPACEAAARQFLEGLEDKGGTK